MGVIRSQLQAGFPQGPRGTEPLVTPERIAEAQAALRMRFLVLAPRRVTALRAALATAVEDEVVRRDLQRLGHQLRGTAATVGLVDLGLLGDTIERSAATVPFTDNEYARCTAAVALVEEYVARALSNCVGSAISDDPRFKALQSQRQ